MKITKQQVYQNHGIVYDPKTDTITAPIFGQVKPLLKKGNTKTGKTVYTWSTLPSNEMFNLVIKGIEYTMQGTCPCHCEGCYAMTGKYNCSNVLNSLAINTLLIREHPAFVEAALIAQIEAENLDSVRIDAAGDIENCMIAVFQNVVKACKVTKFWTYTKNRKAETAFDGLENGNIVKSLTPYGKNYGHCDYILSVYNKLVQDNESVYICRCGIDKNQHCENCKGCSNHKYVLFIEHSTAYKAEKDPAFEELKTVIEKQPKQ